MAAATSEEPRASNSRCVHGGLVASRVADNFSQLFSHSVSVTTDVAWAAALGLCSRALVSPGCVRSQHRLCRVCACGGAWQLGVLRLWLCIFCGCIWLAWPCMSAVEIVSSVGVWWPHTQQRARADSTRQPAVLRGRGERAACMLRQCLCVFVITSEAGQRQCVVTMATLHRCRGHCGVSALHAWPGLGRGHGQAPTVPCRWWWKHELIAVHG
eukprot:jgi/Ulvmu1/8521/UM044_0055.1